MTRHPRARLITLVALPVALLVPLGIAVAGTLVAPAVNHPAAVGPVSADNGFPVWYKDEKGVRLEACLTGTDPFCAPLAAASYDPTLPTSFPATAADPFNFPDEFFYQAVGSSLTIPNGTATPSKATLTLAMEGAFRNGDVRPADQITFGRVRVVITNVPDGTVYTIDHPYGTDTVTANKGKVFFTEDVGIGAAGDFTGALNSRISPFLKWDASAPAAPAGYLGDPAVNHAITGSPYNDAAGNPQNYFSVSGGNLATPQVTNQFSVQGKLATNAGVTANQATYSSSAAGAGSIDVYAQSETGQAIQLKGDAAAGYHNTTLDGEAGRYYGRVSFAGAVPATVTLVNASDLPVTVKTVKVVDAVAVTKSEYDADAKTLTVNAASSDTVNSPVLTATGFGALTGGAAAFTNVSAPPPVIAVTSSAGGSAASTTTGTGGAFLAVPVSAYAGADQTVQQGQAVTLNGSASTGEVSGYAWTQTAGTPVTLTGGTTATPTFTAGNTVETLTFSLTASGPGGPSNDTVDIAVQPVSAPVANAGADKAAVRGSAVTLDGSASTGASSFAWTAPAGVTLTGGTTAKPTFVMPAAGGPLTFSLTVTGPGGVSVADSVVVSPQVDILNVSLARYRTGTTLWRVTGTATVQSGTVKIYNGSTVLASRLINTVPVVAGAWDMKKVSAIAPLAGDRFVTIVSSAGGQITFPLTVTT